MKEITKLHEIQVLYSNQCGKESITSSKQAVELFRSIFKQKGFDINLREIMLLVLLNRANNVIGFYVLSIGGLTETVADIRLAYSTALKCLASGIILAHCHPSGNKKPSKQDCSITTKFKEAGELLDISLLDHLILTNDDYLSFADEGIL